MERLTSILILMGVMFVFLGISFIIFWKFDEARCYNMPLNDFYNDKWCVKHTISWEELNGKR